jgi:hypothetical protein
MFLPNSFHQSRFVQFNIGEASLSIDVFNCLLNVLEHFHIPVFC